MKSNTIRASGLQAADASVNQSAIIKADQLIQCSVQCVVTGSSTGTLKLQFSNDVVTGTATPSNWVDISGATITVSAAGVTGIPKTDLAYGFIKLVWTKNNGSAGTISVNVQAISI